MKHGLHTNLLFDAYAAIDAAHFSGLKHFRRSAAHARYEMLHQSESAAKILGQAVHVAVLEPDRFASAYVGAPKLDRRTKAGREEWEAFEAANASRIVLSASEHELCRELADSVLGHPLAGPLLTAPGHREVTLLWRDANTGLDCKARPDAFVSWDGASTIVDLKTTRDASPRGFAQEIARFAYHLQAAWYLHGADVLAPVPRRFVWVAVEKAPPYAVACYELDSAGIDSGRAEIMECLRRYSLARETDTWPGYPARLSTLYLPAWAGSTTDDEQEDL